MRLLDPFILNAVCLGLLAFILDGCNKVPRLGKDPVKKVIAAMTIGEKAYFLTGTGMDMAAPGDSKKEDRSPGSPPVGQPQKLVPGAAVICILLREDV